ncbi:MAG: endonuclease MutS2 [Bacteroidetes bacterium]|nr:endonuclease MutS2 [Bacteroidota bacterium]
MISSKTIEQLEFPKILESIAKYASTETGKKLILKIHQLDSIQEIELSGQLVDEAKEIIIKQHSIPIMYLPDLQEQLIRSRIEGTILSIKDIHDVLNLASSSRILFQFLKTNAIESKLFRLYGELLFVNKNFEGLISRIFTESGEIKDNASSDLKEIRKKIIEKSESLRKTVNVILKRLSESYLVQEEYITQRDGRIVLPVKAEHKRHVRGFIHSESATGQTVYVEPEETLEMNNEILSLKFAEKREIERILRALTARIGEDSYNLIQSQEAVSNLDKIFAKAHYSNEIIGSFPTIDKNLPLNIIDARHPLLVKKLGRDLSIPLNVKVKNQKVILITGPNAGGKTVVLKTVGLLSLMVQSGLHIPSDPDSNFHIFENILIDIGDQQSIEDDLSTFSSHLKNINFIIKNADGNTLVLLDEVGTGTDPVEGSAIATAILINLNSQKALTFATTHHGNLKLIANDLEGFENASMKFDSEKLAPTYLFIQGKPGSSYAFEVANKIGLPQEIIESAKNYIDSDKTKIENFLVEIEKKSNILEEKLKSAEIENTRLKGLANLYESKVKKLENEKKEIILDVKTKADTYLKDVNKRVEQTIKNIKESNAAKNVIKNEKNIISVLKKENEEFIKANKTLAQLENYIPQIGDYIRIKDTDATGEIISLDGDIAFISSGSIKLKVNVQQLLHEKKLKKILREDKYSHYIKPIKSQRLDIRGQKPEEAEMKIIRFLDDAYASSQSNIEILHGKGTGVLKQLVQDVLKAHTAVKNYHFAKIEFGGVGITIVELN